MLARFKELADTAYDLQEALELAKLKQDDIDRFRKMVETLEHVPKSIIDKQVKTTF